MLCPNCETENREGAKFCDECGFPLTGAIAARAAEAFARSGEVPGATEAMPPAGEDLPELEDLGIQVDWPEEYQVSDEAEDASEHAADDKAAADGADEASAPAQAAPESNAKGATPQQPDITVAINADLSGLDTSENDYGERVVGADYQQPQANWRDGSTMQMPRVEGDEAPRSRDYLASSTTKQNNGKKTAIGIAIAVVVVVALVAFATYQMQLWGGKVIPDVRGMTEADATSVLEENGFEVRSTQVKSDDTEGLVLIMDPTAGARANEGDEIVIHIATARSVPNVVGKSEKEAKKAFEEDGYENVTFESEHSDEAEGTVLSISPEPGTRAKSTTAIIVKVAEPYKVPDASSLDLEGTINAIMGAGLGFDIAYVDTQDYPDGTVIGTDPAAGTKVKSDTVVVIEVARARGPELVQLTRDMLSPGSTITIDGVSYEVESLGSVEYAGNDTVTFSFTGRPFTYFMGQYIALDTRNVTGQVVWTPDNGVSGIF